MVAALGSLEILVRLYAKLVLPREVWDELQAGGQESKEVKAVRAQTGLEVRVEGVAIHDRLSRALDLGEAAVIQTALDHGIDRVVLDERLGRKVAAASGLKVTGTLGILVRAKKEAMIPAITPCLKKMMEAGIRISGPLAQAALQEAGEIG